MADISRLLPGNCPDDSSDVVRRLRDFLPYIHVRGWCLEKIKAFNFRKAAKNSFG
jgi:hypothetical protein